MSAKILIIDDEKIQASFYELAFKRKGYEVQQALDVDTALLIVSEWKPDVVILDIMMPPGSTYAQTDHFSGLRTGTFLIPDILQMVPGVIVVVSTVVKNPETLDIVRRLLPPRQVTLKSSYDPQQLAELVQSLLEAQREGGRP